eukprot:2336397-Pyramimonas_sp.AAC.1
MARAQRPPHGATAVQNRNQQHPVGPPRGDAGRSDTTTPSHTRIDVHWHLARFRQAAACARQQRRARSASARPANLPPLPGVLPQTQVRRPGPQRLPGGLLHVHLPACLPGAVSSRWA